MYPTIAPPRRPNQRANDALTGMLPSRIVKRTQQCPKCQGRKLWIIERYRIPGEYAGGVELPIVSHQKEEGGFLSMARTSPQGRFDLWVCEGCGYTELWAAGLSGLREDPSLGVRRVDTTPEPAGPFR